jgi:hypothetical protein
VRPVTATTLPQESPSGESAEVRDDFGGSDRAGPWLALEVSALAARPVRKPLRTGRLHRWCRPGWSAGRRGVSIRPSSVPLPPAGPAGDDGVRTFAAISTRARLRGQCGRPAGTVRLRWRRGGQSTRRVDHADEAFLAARDRDAFGQSENNRCGPASWAMVTARAPSRAARKRTVLGPKDSLQIMERSQPKAD